MKCPYCGAEESKVIDSRPTEDSERIRRRRECLNCHMRFTTYEVVETVPLIVIKKDNSREPFDRQKLLNAMLRACAKRPVSYESLERAVSSIDYHSILQNGNNGASGSHFSCCTSARRCKGYYSRQYRQTYRYERAIRRYRQASGLQEIPLM